MSIRHAIEQTLKDAPTRTVRELREAIGALGLTAERLAPLVQQPQQLPYGRTTLYSGERVEAVLIHLPPGSATFIHDHGCSVGCAKVLEGTVTNRLFRLDEAGYPCCAAEAEVRAGELLLAPRGQIHQLANGGRERAVSFHLYAPRLSGTQRYYAYEEALDYVI